MSYCRWGKDSDVYVYGTAFYDKDKRRTVYPFVCQDCALDERAQLTFMAATAYDMVSHLLEHREKGHLVPEDALERLREESAKESAKEEPW